jgi:hypothetical protein
MTIMKSILAVAVALFAFASFGYAKDFPLTASPSVPAAKGKVEVSKDQNSNRTVKLEVQHLAKPSTLTPAQTNYVVWVQARGRDPENKGQLVVNDKLEGKLETTTQYEAFDIFVTGEVTPSVSAPSGPEVLRGTVQP